MNELRLNTTLDAPRAPDSPAKVRDAAQQFEALLIGQILRSAHASGGWLGGGDATSDSAMEFAEQQLALEMSRGGGLGLADLIARGLSQTASPSDPKL